MSCATHCWFNSPQDFFLQSHTPPATPPSLRLSSAASPPASQSAAAACPDASCFHSPARTQLRRSRRILSSTMKHRRLQILLVADVRNGLLLDQMFSQNRNFFLRRVIVSFFLQGTSVVSILTAVYSISD